ncbi:MAG: ATP-binding protein [Oscillospiraceae bacterium]|nr:ATP-binding protein [Oscillospiraceae bacterium]
MEGEYMDLVMPKDIYTNCNFDGLLWRISKLESKEVVRLDLDRITFIRPEAIVLLLILSSDLFHKTGQPIEWMNINKEVHSYLDRMELDKLDFIHIPPVRKQFQWNRAKSNSYNLTELLIIKQARDCETVMRRIKEMIAKWFPEKMGNDYYRILPTLITEIAGNSLEHSIPGENGTCYLIAQKYITTQSVKIVVSFGDAGIGIRKSLRKTNEWIANDDLYCIKKAFYEGASCRADRSGGLGFCQVKSTLQKYGGEVSIRSGTGVLRYSSKKELKSCSFRESLPGTQTTFIL